MRVRGEFLRLLREQQGWTQDQLADHAGYSDRLIRKAEAGGALHPDTIEVLADALSTETAPIFPEDLVTSPAAAVRSFVEAYRKKERQLVANFHTHLDDNVECFVAGDPEQIPFAGIWKTVDGFDSFWGSFFQLFSRPSKELYTPTVVTDGLTCIAIGQEQVELKDANQMTQSWVTIMFKFERGKIVKIDDFFDTAATAQIIREMRAKRQTPKSPET
ncbi:hypothetical protein DSM3645_12821 [Blastopirellula marina DSM 3645]|uniref:HTH cro/C1-type domain-containing protein n=2 Tax=Blastopirellula marina TaxID=124 RepID=A3ZRY1_9BACT|nr:hypothetical protein DSM3645_12821 [Blastopirellula marina DSM 3645]